MKIAEMREGQRVTWRGRGGEVLYVQPPGTASDIAVEDCIATARRDLGHPQPLVTTPRGAWHGDMWRHKRSVLVRLDREVVTNERGTYLDDPRYLWATPSALYPEAGDE